MSFDVHGVGSGTVQRADGEADRATSTDGRYGGFNSRGRSNSDRNVPDREISASDGDRSSCDDGRRGDGDPAMVRRQCRPSHGKHPEDAGDAN